MGNSRVTFAEGEQIFLATMETENATVEDAEFNNIAKVTNGSANHTSGGNEAIRLNKDNTIGPSIGIKVFPGDVIDAEAFAYYEGGSDYGSSSSLSTLITALAGAFGGSSGGGSESGFIYDFMNDGLTAQGLAGNNGSTVPAGYLNWIQFDKNMVFVDGGFSSLSSAADFDHEKVSLTNISISEEGYLYIYISHESTSNSYVYWDDFKVTYRYSHTVQTDDYYAFGMKHDKQYVETPENRYLFNGGGELNAKLGVYETPFRQYDPVTGRFNAIDAMASSFNGLTPYHFAGNNPVSANDPTGLYPSWYQPGMFEEWAQAQNEGANRMFVDMTQAFGTALGSGGSFVDNIYSGQAKAQRDLFQLSSKEFSDKYGRSNSDYMETFATIREITYSKPGNSKTGKPYKVAVIRHNGFKGSNYRRLKKFRYKYPKGRENVYVEEDGQFTKTKIDFMFAKGVGFNALYTVLGYYSIHEVEGNYRFNASAAGLTPNRGKVSFEGRADLFVDGKAVDSSPFELGEGFVIRWPDGFSSVGSLNFELPENGESVVIFLNFSYHIRWGSKGERQSSTMVIPIYIRQFVIPKASGPRKQ